MFSNRREFLRCRLSAKITLTIDDVILYGTECKNISKGGMCVVVGDRLDECDDGMLIMVNKYKDEVIYFKANFIVSWNNILSPNQMSTKIGIAFKDLDSRNREALERIISYQSDVDN